MSKNHLAHLSDFHVRYNSRQEEYKIVLNRTIDDLKSIKPRRIVLAGDLFHTKINMSPTSVSIVGDFLSRLSEISPTDILIGNHDCSLTSLSQGDSITPIIELLPNGYIITKENPELPIPKNHAHGIYYFKESGFYNVDDEIIYGVYSMLDNEILSLTKKEKGKKYIALYHGPVFGAQMDNGYEAAGDSLIKPSVFNGFSAALLGDFHTFQVIQEYDEEKQKPAIIFPGSLIQQNFGESIDKGYVLWDLDNFSHERRFILNDYGYCRLNIYKGEIWEDRIQDLKFSLNKKKTKIEIIIHDDKENYSVEKLSQIEKYIKDRHGCESVSADFQSIDREIGDSTELNEEEIDVNNTESAEKLLTEYLTQNNYDNTEDVIELSREIDNKLSIKQNPTHGMRLDFNSMEVSNLLSFPVAPVFFDFDRLSGLTGVLGPNYNGKSNVMKVFCFILYGKMPGDFENSKLINLYTNVTKGWGKIHFTIAGVKYYAHRGVTVKRKKDGTPDVSYQIEYKKQIHFINELTNESELKWVDVESEKAATEKGEKKKLITDYIGTYEDFMVCAMQTNDQNYLSLAQQPKNDLINKFLGLEVYRDKYDLGNDIFKTIKARQKVLGDPAELETQINDFKTKLLLEKDSLEKHQKEKGENNKKIDEFNDDINKLTEKLHKIEVPAETNVENIEVSIASLKTDIGNGIIISKEKESWLKDNFKKDLSEELKSLDISSIKETNVEVLKSNIEKAKVTIEEYGIKIKEKEEWLGLNFKKDLSDELKDLDISSIKEKNVDVLKSNIEKVKISIEIAKSKSKTIEEWLEKNFKKEISENLKNLDKVKVEKELNLEKSTFDSEKKEYVAIENWLKENEVRVVVKQEPVEDKIANCKFALSGLSEKLKIAKGEKCPTCNHVSHEANPEAEKKCINDIERGNKTLKELQDELAKIKTDNEHNAKHEKETNKLSSLKISLQARQKNMLSLKSDLELSSQKDEFVIHNKKIDDEATAVKEIKTLILLKEEEIAKLSGYIDSIEKHAKKEDILKHNKGIDDEISSVKEFKNSITSKEEEIVQLTNNIDSIEKYSKKKEIVLHNQKVDDETLSLTNAKNSITEKEKEIVILEEQIKTLEKNKTLVLENTATNELIKNKKEEINVYKVMNLQVDTKIKESSGNIGAGDNNIENLSEKLESIRDTDRVYKKYSVYLQAVGRDGIPAMIIKKKLPIINHKINSLLKSMVAFKVEMTINIKGDVKEIFYFSDNKMDSLPIGSGSGSIKFITSTAISDSLHFVSSLIKPSLKVIDEGFDTLSSKKLEELGGMFNYLRTKYKNIFIVTHKSEVRDYVDNIIEVEKTKDGITDPEVLANPEAGISKFVYS